MKLPPINVVWTQDHCSNNSVEKIYSLFRSALVTVPDITKPRKWHLGQREPENWTLNKC